MNKIYHLECEPDGCEVSAIINGLPFYEANGTNAPVIISKPINSVLIGIDNEVKLLIKPPFSTNEVKSLEPYSVKVKIKLYDSDDITGPEKGVVLVENKFNDTPIGTLKFNNEIYNFSNRLVNSPKIKKEEVLQYALLLKEILESKNIELVVKEFLEKLKDYAFVYGDSQESMITGFKEYIKNYYFNKSPRLDFTKDDIVLDAWCEDRVWQVSVGLDREELILSKPDEEGMEYATKIFVGKIDNTLKIIR
jgi:hypothetical protein